MLLRSYQERSVAEIRATFSRGARRVLFVLPTGGGKTTVFPCITTAVAARGNRVCVLVYRQDFIDQVSGALAALNIPRGISPYPRMDIPCWTAADPHRSIAPD